jgi:hypothetical protein
MFNLQSLSTCDWVNAVAQSTLAGELTVIFSHQLLIGVDTEKGMKDKRMVRVMQANTRSQFAISVTLKLELKIDFIALLSLLKLHSPIRVLFFLILFLAPTGAWGIHETFRFTSVS